MVTYRFYSRADAAQDKIWRDTFDKWGEAQAITYIMGLHEYLRLLCRMRRLRRRPPQALYPNADSLTAPRHPILFKILFTR